MFIHFFVNIMNIIIKNGLVFHICCSQIRMRSYTISISHTFRNTLATFNFIIIGYNTSIPSLIVKLWVSKEFDKSGFDKVI